jgi:hypothetical protein
VRGRAARAVGRYRGARIRRRLAALAASGRPIVAGPWLGEVGFEILYWAPFLRWFASEFGVAPDRITAVSRGGTAGWYAPAAGRYADVFDHVSPGEFRQWREEHVGEIGEQKQRRVTARERALLDRLLAAADPGAEVLHPSLMYELLNPYWWRHLDEAWVARHTVYRRLEPPARVAGLQLPERYVAAKFYFNDCFPPTDENRTFVRTLLDGLRQRGPVVVLSAGISVDDHSAYAPADQPAIDVAAIASPAQNLHVQSAIVANAERVVGTYGGFAYVAPFYGVPCTAYYADAAAFSRAHLTMAQSALAALRMPDLLAVRPASGSTDTR